MEKPAEPELYGYEDHLEFFWDYCEPELVYFKILEDNLDRNSRFSERIDTQKTDPYVRELSWFVGNGDPAEPIVSRYWHGELGGHDPVYESDLCPAVYLQGSTLSALVAEREFAERTVPLQLRD